MLQKIHLSGMKNLISNIGLLAILSVPALAQQTDTLRTAASVTPAIATPSANNELTISGYIEAYYAHELNSPKLTQERPGFLYNFKRNREVNVNLAFIKLAYQTERVRGNLALQAGTYAQYNYAAEQLLMQHIYEANAGVKLTKSAELWLDAGVFSSHIGFESAIGKDNWTLTRSMVAENSPYYLAGAKLTYNTRDGKWTLLGSVVNGWQRIKRLDGLSKPGISTQVQFRPSASVTLNWSTFFGSDRPDSLSQHRMYHNLYGQFQRHKVGVILGFDIGRDRMPVLNGRRSGEGYFTWLTPVAILRYKCTDAFRIAGRIEYFQDKHEVIIATRSGSGFETLGYSLNADYAVTPRALFRIEARQFSGKGTYFANRQGGPARLNTALTTSLSIQF